MQLHAHRRRIPEGMTVGWISTADAFFFGLIMLLVLAISLERQNTDLVSAKETMADKLAFAEDSLDELQRGYEIIEQEHMAACQERESLKSELATEREQLDKMKDELQATQAQLVVSEKKRRDETGELQKRLERAATIYREHQQKIAALTDHVTELTKQLADLSRKYEVEQASFTVEIDKLKGIHAAEKGVRAELIGLRGSLKRVAILCDASRSMLQGNRWEEARNVIDAWLKHLDMEECVLVVFSGDVRTFPDDGTMLDLRGPSGDANRKALIDALKNHQPEGGTNTLAALKAAYDYQGLESIVLFTDGAPNDGNSAEFDPAVAKEIYELCRSHSTIPINSVGLGDYFHPELSEFLITIAGLTEGTYLGR